MKLSLLITFFNEEKMIRKTHAKMTKEQLQAMLGSTLDDYELLYIDDGSKDATLAIMRELAEQDQRILHRHES